ncbi:MAG: hypothetical protein MK086_05485 [Flavobacteriales bacterium]|nr:hypothetical protein [Flavobacteriales bacterium]
MSLQNFTVNENYATGIESFKGQLPETVKTGLRINTRTTGTFVIQAVEEKYKEMVLKALDQYSDLIVNYIKSARE